MRRRFLLGVLVFYAALVAAVVFGPEVLAKKGGETPTVCTGTLAHATTNDITVPDGAVCRVTASRVNGSVTVKHDAYFETSGTDIRGSVRATGALTVFLHDGTSVGGSVRLDGSDQLFLYKTTVHGAVKVDKAVAPGFGHVQVCQTSAGSIEVEGSGPDVLIGDPAAGCLGNSVKDDLTVKKNNTASELQVSGNTIKGNLVVTDNSGSSPKHVTDNSVQGKVEISDNAPPFDASNN